MRIAVPGAKDNVWEMLATKFDQFNRNACEDSAIKHWPFGMNIEYAIQVLKEQPVSSLICVSRYTAQDRAAIFRSAVNDDADERPPAYF